MKKKKSDMYSFSVANVSLTFLLEVFVHQEGKIHSVKVSIEIICEFSRVSVSFSTFRAGDVLVS